MNAKQTNKDKIYVTRWNEYFGSFPENSLNGGVWYNEPSI